MSTKNLELLHDFIARARAQGKTESEIKAMLVSAGWDETLVVSAITPAADLTPPPPPAPKSSGREIFFYLLQFFTMGTAAFSLGGVVFAILDRYLSDKVSQSYYYVGGSPLTGALASLIVALPVFMAVSWKLIKDVKAGRTSVRSGIRRVITYLALFLASATVIGDVIALVYRFLAGEVDMLFLFKVVTILAIGGWVIWYYYATVKKDERGEPYPINWHKFHGLALAVVFLLTMAGGFMITGTPQERQRFVRDNERVMELQNIHYQVRSFFEREQKLPESLAVLAYGYVPNEPRDPLTGEAYRYRIISDLNYELCATFETDDKVVKKLEQPYYLETLGQVNWSHPAGDYCFKLTVTPRVK